MRLTTPFVALAATSLVSAVPVKRNADSNPNVVVLKFANVLEQLESKFYEEAIAKFKDQDFTSAGYPSPQLPMEQIKTIQFDEQAHSDFLQGALKGVGQKPLEGCKFNFDAALTDVDTMIATARTLEIVGIGAYLGGATLINDPVILDAAGSILTVEARHSTLTNILGGASAVASAFDIPLSPAEVLSIAGPFISGCDLSPLGQTANPTLTITNKGSVQPGTKLTFKSDAINGSIPEDKLSCQMMLGGAPNAIVLPFNECVVPDKVNGPVHVFVTKDSQPLVNNIRDRGVVLAGPAPALIDSKKEVLSSLVKSKSGSGSGDASVSTQTISPAAASSIISGASNNASSTGSSASGAPTPSPAGNVAAAPSSSPSGGGPSEQTGKSADGAVTVNGWSEVPAPKGSAASAAPSSSSAPSSGGGGGYGGY
jgi:hypothetical protein